jgi:hypothetical protein
MFPLLSKLSIRLFSKKHQQTSEADKELSVSNDGTSANWRAWTGRLGRPWWPNGSMGPGPFSEMGRPTAPLIGLGATGPGPGPGPGRPNPILTASRLLVGTRHVRPGASKEQTTSLVPTRLRHRRIDRRRRRQETTREISCFRHVLNDPLYLEWSTTQSKYLCSYHQRILQYSPSF